MIEQRLRCLRAAADDQERRLAALEALTMKLATAQHAAATDARAGLRTGKKRLKVGRPATLRVGQVWRRRDGTFTGPCFHVDRVDIIGVAVATAGLWDDVKLVALLPVETTMIWPADLGLAYEFMGDGTLEVPELAPGAVEVAARALEAAWAAFDAASVAADDMLAAALNAWVAARAAARCREG